MACYLDLSLLFLGVHPAGKGYTACAFLPDAVAVTATTLDGKVVGDLASIHPDGLFLGKVTVRKRWGDAPWAPPHPSGPGAVIPPPTRLIGRAPAASISPLRVNITNLRNE